MANGTTDYSLGGLNARMTIVEKQIECLTEATKQQQTTIDKALGGIGIFKWLAGAGFIGLIVQSIVAIATKLIN